MKAKVTAIILAALLATGSLTVLAAGGRGGMGGRNGNFGGKSTQIERVECPEKGEMPELTEEQKAEMLAKVTEKLDEMLENGEITEEQYNERLEKLEAGELPFGQTVGKGFGRSINGEKPEMPEDFEKPEKPELTDEQKAEMLAKVTEKLDEMLANGEITEEQYNERLEKLEAGEFPFGHTVGKGFDRGINGEKPEMPEDFEKPEMPELTEEQKAEMLAKVTEKLDEMLANGEITEEQYNERLEKLEAGEIPFGQTVGKGFGRGNGFDRGKAPVRGFGGFEGRGNGFGRRPSEIPYDGEVEASEAEGEVVEVRANARKIFGGRNFGGMREDSDVKL